MSQEIGAYFSFVKQSDHEKLHNSGRLKGESFISISFDSPQSELCFFFQMRWSIESLQQECQGDGAKNLVWIEDSDQFN